jgi:hypothetical protein
MVDDPIQAAIQGADAFFSAADSKVRSMFSATLPMEQRVPLITAYLQAASAIALGQALNSAGENVSVAVVNAAQIAGHR